jgi:hypothetical protein
VRPPRRTAHQYRCPGPFGGDQYGQAMLWQLTVAGFEPLLQPYFTEMSGITYPRDPSSSTVNVIMTDHGNFAHIQKVVIGTYHPAIPLHTQTLIPRTGATPKGSKIIVAWAVSSPRPVTGVQFVVTGGSLTDRVVGTAVRTPFGWTAIWDTTTIPNGVYTLQSVATEAGGATAMSRPIDMTTGRPEQAVRLRDGGLFSHRPGAGCSQPGLREECGGSGSAEA